MRYPLRFISTSGSNHKDDVIASMPIINKNDAKSFDFILRRFRITAEVTVSKIFPAGFGWQTFATGATHLGYSANDVGFFLMTGVGDAFGVAIGHTLYYTIKKYITQNPEIDIAKESQISVFLGSAALFSGTAWQPAVNLLQASGALPFTSVATGASICCGLAFFTGLRLFRMIYSHPKVGLSIEPNDYNNLKADAALSVSIGGASGAFVGTDTAYLGGSGNFLRPIVGVEGTDAALVASTKAGLSTAIGFAAVQSAQNIAYSKGKNWTD